MSGSNALLMPKSTVLIVDDDETTRMLATQFLGDAGFDVAEAPDGETALSILADVNPDLLLLDVDMPGMSGFDVCRVMRSRSNWRAIPIMMLTSSDDAESIETAFDCGATDFSIKPVSWELLAHRIRYLLRSAQTLIELDVAQQSAALGSWSGFDGVDQMRWSAELFNLLGLDRDTNKPSWTLLEQSVPLEERPKLIALRTEALAHGTGELHHAIVRRSDGQRRVVRHRIESVSSGDEVRALQGTLQDITERHEMDQRIRRLAFYDPLTGLPNRAAFQDNLNNAMSLAQRRKQLLAVLYLDLDDFKRVNESLGHSAGDKLLGDAAERLRGVLRNNDLVGRIDHDSEDPELARLGGDEFAIIITDLDEHADIDGVARRVMQVFELPFLLSGDEVRVTPSVGVACYPQDGEDEESLLKHADMAMYEAKRDGKNCIRFHDDALFAAARRRHQLELELANALPHGEMTLVYQPQLELGRRDVQAVEALLRWHSGPLGSVSPVEFIPIAEHSDLIVSIGEWVLRSACRQVVSWRNNGIGITRVSVNVSVKQFVRSDFVDRVRGILEETDCPAEALELEITESVLATDSDRAIAILEKLKQLGLSLSIDDFGTGYSSLSYLKRFPVDRLKIDRSFIRDIVTDANDAAITSAVIGIARGMGVRVIAEGVETESQLKALIDRGCDEVQGYLISRPVSPIELETWLESDATARVGATARVS